jgi:spermidine synthase
MPYSLIPIGISALILYGLSFLFSRSGLLSRTVHRQIWNTALLLTFLATATLGIILAIQVNYKLEMPAADKLIIWHVDLGIGMSFIALFHFTWHWSYYRKILLPVPGKKIQNGKKQGPVYPVDHGASHHNIPAREKIPLVTLGATAMITQVVFLREFLAVFHGNELVIGLVLAGWLVLTGTGAMLGMNPLNTPGNSVLSPAAFLILGILPLLSVTGIRFFKNLVFPVGSMAGIPGITIYAAASMALFCLLSGFLFTWLSSEISMKYKSNLLNFTYALESIGSLAAGMLFSFVLVPLLNTFQILFIVLLANLAAALVQSPRKNRLNIMVPGALLLILSAIMVFPVNLDLRSRAFLFPNQTLVQTRDTPYGNIAVSKTGNQYNLFENAIPLSASGDLASVEEDVHYAMVQHPHPEDILVLSGDISSMAVELAKYQVGHADYVELNPWIYRIGKKYFPYPDLPWLNVVNMDGRRFLSRTERHYDVILVNLPSPGTAGLNRYYTEEFFALVKSRLKPGGIFSMPLHGAGNYVSPETGNLFSILYQTLETRFEHILVIPGYKTYFLASGSELELDIPSLIDSRGIETEYVNSFYLDLYTLKERNRQVMEFMTDSPGINRDFRPVAFLHQISYWLSFFKSNLWFTLGIMLLIILLVGFRKGVIGKGIFITGFTGMGLEFVLLLAIQIVFGYVYLYAAVVMTVFMMGLAAGALGVRRFIPVFNLKYFALLQILLAFTILLVLAWLILIENRILPEVLLHGGFLLLTFLSASLSGLLFGLGGLMGRKGIQRTVGGLYSADLSGSAAGALGVSILMIPLLGLYGSLIGLLGLNILAGFYSLSRKNSV